jgi:RNA polymerase sigma factor (sigma-70 family)
MTSRITDYRLLPRLSPSQGHRAQKRDLDRFGRNHPSGTPDGAASVIREDIRPLFRRRPPIQIPQRVAPLAPVISPHERVPDAIDAQLARLAAQAQSGDRAARNALYLALLPRISSSIRKLRYSGNWSRCEGRSWFFDDLEQEAFLIFCELVEEWNPKPPRFAGYFFSRLPWRLRDRLRTWGSTTLRESQPLPLDALCDDIADPAIVRVMIETLLAAIDPDHADVLRLRYIDGLREREIAFRLGITTRTVRRRHAHGMVTIRSLL